MSPPFTQLIKCSRRALITSISCDPNNLQRCQKRSSRKSQSPLTNRNQSPRTPNKSQRKNRKTSRTNNHSKSQASQSKNPSKKSTISVRVIRASKTQQTSQTKSSLLTSTCRYHLQKNTLFCESCQQVVCYKCISMGPHNNKLHKPREINEAFRERFIFLQNMIFNQLLTKRDALTEQSVRVQQHLQALKLNKYKIQREIKLCSAETLDRLKESQGRKLAVLHHQMAQLQRQLQAINALGNDFFFLTNRQPAGMVSDNGMIAFLIKQRSMRLRLQDIIGRPYKQQVDVYPYDLPRDISERRLILDKAKKMTARLNIKNQIIWKLLQQVKEKQKQLRRQTEIAVFEESSEWEKIKTALQDELKELEMGCIACGVRLSKSSVNQFCLKSLGSSERHKFK